jgi:hypothetical protein
MITKGSFVEIFIFLLESTSISGVLRDRKNANESILLNSHII